jgi:hypothetical protein
LTVLDSTFTIGTLGGSTSTLYPIPAARDSFSTPAGTYGRLELSNLNQSKKYDIKLFGCRFSSTSVQKYTVEGVVKTLDIKNNILTTVDFLNMAPNAGIITIRVEGNTGSTIGHLNVIEIIEHN